MSWLPGVLAILGLGGGTLILVSVWMKSAKLAPLGITLQSIGIGGLILWH